jgi:hypothetical protein
MTVGFMDAYIAQHTFSTAYLYIKYRASCAYFTSRA